jgi:RNA polymerase sigma-70 factor (ECF subfamily)
VAILGEALTNSETEWAFALQDAERTTSAERERSEVFSQFHPFLPNDLRRWRNFTGGPTWLTGAEYASTMPASPNDAFLDAVARRDRAAWGALYDAHLHEIYGFVSDLTQEVWLQAIACIEKFDPSKGALRDWLFGIARRQVALHFRRLSTSNVSLPDAFGPELEPADDALLLPQDIMEQVEGRRLVRAAFTTIPLTHQHVLRQKYIDGQSVQEIAATMKTTAKAVESHLSRARARLRTLLGPYFAPAAQAGGASP